MLNPYQDVHWPMITLRKPLILLLLLGCRLALCSQNPYYTLEVDSAAYVPLEGAQVMGPILNDMDGGWDDPYFQAMVLFEFPLFGDACTSFIQDGLGNYMLSEVDDINSNLLVPGAYDIADIGLVGEEVSEIRWMTEGVLGDRIFKLEWWDCGYYEEIIQLDSLGPSRYNAQLWLHEATGVIEYRFGIVDIQFDLELPAMPIGLGHNYDGNNSGEFFMLSGDEGSPDLVEVTFNTVFSATLTGSPALGRIYRFLPEMDGVASTSANHLLAVYPNPSNTTIQFNTGPGITYWALYDLMGREVDQGACQGQGTLDVKALKLGTYFLSVEGFKPARVMVK